MSYVKNMQSFGKLKGICTGLGGAYNPGQQNLKVKALTTIQFNAQQVMDEVIIAKTTYDNVTNQRELAFRDLRSLGSRICYLLRASNAHPLTLADAMVSNRALQGRLKYRVAKPRAGEGEEPISGKQRSRSSDFANQLQYFAQLVKTALAEPTYNPTEPQLAGEALEQKVVELRSLNELVMKTEQTLARVRQQRRDIFYEGEHSLVKTARAVKSYIRGVFGFRSTPHMETINVSLIKR
ncbi:MAG: hypothetical protein RIA63_00165 [Cyclobacteriaceae bacterium]